MDETRGNRDGQPGPGADDPGTDADAGTGSDTSTSSDADAAGGPVRGGAGGGLAERFEVERPRLRAVAYRVLGSSDEAEDAVQEAWLRLDRADAAEVRDLTAWLTTVVGRICLNLLRSRATRREESWEAVATPEADAAAGGRPPAAAGDPEQQAVLADSVGRALLVVLDTLGPAERLAFVLHDLFAVPFEAIGPIVERSPAAARQLASRARRRVADAPGSPEPDMRRQREVVEAFRAASRDGDFEALVGLLDPDALLRVDAVAAGYGTVPARGGTAVARVFSGRAKAAVPVLASGVPAMAWAPGGRLRVLVAFTLLGGRITAVDVLSDPEQLARLDVVYLEQPR
ncbi:sigma-70 family RNA polymerase sigma factor [Actinacidiphila yeochonensis]|uniref:sigma-70 family RNA polymerase sigma factor n=1 Tax=Actinacidiphila yeochonensis TaxID=89050 RepID=UPI00099C8AE1|nr:sigma-70 family RNA polymerase sigma factor [Actinacidiphila yeochonensis]